MLATVKTWDEAAEVLRAAGLALERRSSGLRGTARAGSSGGYVQLDIGHASTGGDELSVRPASGHPVRWFHRPTLDALVALLVDAQTRVRSGEQPALLDALLELDGRG
jgi:hypothetical protein